MLSGHLPPKPVRKVNTYDKHIKRNNRVEWISRSPAQRIGFVNPSMTSLLQVVVAFKAYHVLRQKDREGCSHHCPNERILCAIDLIRHFLIEIPRSLKAHCTGDVCTAAV